MKYEFTDETRQVDSRILHRIKAIKDFGAVRTGDLGGWIEVEENLSQIGECWIWHESMAYGGARVSGDAQVWGDHAVICGNTEVCEDAMVYGFALVESGWLGGDDKVNH